MIRISMIIALISFGVFCKAQEKKPQRYYSSAEEKLEVLYDEALLLLAAEKAKADSIRRSKPIVYNMEGKTYRKETAEESKKCRKDSLKVK